MRTGRKWWMLLLMLALGSVTYRAQADLPAAQDDLAETTADAAVDIAVLDNDYDPDGDPLSIIEFDQGDYGAVTDNGDGTLRYTPLDPNSEEWIGDAFSYVIDDGNGGTATAWVFVTVSPRNHPPVGQDDEYDVYQNLYLDAYPPIPGVLANDEDEDGNILTAVLDQGPSHGTLELEYDGYFRYTPETNYNGSDVFTYYPSDGKLNGEATQVRLTIRPFNQPPEVGEITATRPLNIADALEAEAPFSDPNAGDTHTALWTWGDGTSSAGAVDETSGIVSGSHEYEQAGIYDVQLLVTDRAGASDTAYYRAIVFDPEGGFATGGCWIMNPGKVNLTFNTRYQAGDLTPSGQVEIQIKASDLRLKAASQMWLVVDGSRAIFRGSGAVNSRGNFGFLVSILDAGQARRPDYVRIKIWNEDTGDVIFDTQPGEDDTALPTTPLGGGNLVVHK